jgi:hypothetical protein
MGICVLPSRQGVCEVPQGVEVPGAVCEASRTHPLQRGILNSENGRISTPRGKNDTTRQVSRRNARGTLERPRNHEDRKKARDLATNHRQLLGRTIDSPNDLLNFVIWIGCATLAGDVSIKEARAIAALLLPFAKVGIPLSIEHVS